MLLPLRSPDVSHPHCFSYERGFLDMPRSAEAARSAAVRSQQYRLLRALETHLLAEEGPLTPLFYGGKPYTPYTCPICGTHWGIDPTGRNIGRVTPTSVLPEAMPPALCRRCTLEHRGGALEIDQYGGGLGGYGYDWETDDPVGGHVLLVWVEKSWSEQVLHHPHPGIVEPVTAPERARHVLAWLANQRHWPHGQALTDEKAQDIAQGNPPGHGVPDLWWKGMHFSLPDVSPFPEGQASIVMLAIAVPRQEPLVRDALLRIGQMLALLSASVQLPGEGFSVASVRQMFQSLEWGLEPKRRS